MELQTNETIKTVIGKTTTKTLITTQLKRTRDGVKLFVKSSFFEKFFKDFGENRDWYVRQNDGTKVYCYNMPNPKLDNIELEDSIGQFENTLRNTSSGIINMGFIRAVGISNGITFDINGVYSRTALQSYVNELKTTVKKFYEVEMKNEDLFLEFKVLERV